MRSSELTRITIVFWSLSLIVPFFAQFSAASFLPIVFATLAFAFTIWIEIKRIDEVSEVNAKLKDLDHKVQMLTLGRR